MLRAALALACAAVVAWLPSGAAAAAQPSSPLPERLAERAPAPDAAAWLLLDARDGTTLAAHAATQRLPIASTTKLMTAELVLRNLGLRRELTAPEYHPTYGESLMGLRKGERVRVRDLMYGLLLPSGNDAAVALADGVAGSVPAFVAQMNREAARLGLADTHYANPIGLDDPGNYSTASDLATLALRLRRDPTFRRIVNTRERAVTTGSRRIRLENTNPLLQRFGWVNGVKTGHTLEAGEVLVASAVRHGVKLLSVVLGAPSDIARDDGSLDLLRYGFSLYHRVRAVRPGQRLAAAGLSFRDSRVGLVADRAVNFIARKGQRVRTHVLRAPAELESATRGERLGSAEVTLDGAVRARVPLVAARSVAGPTIADRIDAALPGGRTAAWLIAGGAAALVVGALALAIVGRRRGWR